MAIEERTQSSIKVNKDLDSCIKTVLAVEEYPSWAPDIKEVNVLEKDKEGRPLVVRFRAASFGRTTSYTLKYDYSNLPDKISWSLDTGDLVSKLDGSYEFRDENGLTEILYELDIVLKIPIPGFIKRRAEAKIISTALSQLKKQIEAS